jgi:hypothetical protein
MNNRNIPVGKPVTGKELIGRESDIRTIMQLLEQGQSIVLLGSRRTGKTSVMLELLRRLKNRGYYTMNTDVFTSPTAGMFAESITSGVLANRKLDAAFSKMKQSVKFLINNTQFRQVVENHEFIFGFAEKQQDGLKLLDESVEFMDAFPGKYNKKLYAGFDEFGDIDKYNGGSVSKMFRSRLQLQKNTCCIFTGSYEAVMNELFVTRKSPFYRFARIFRIGNIPVEIFREYFVTKLKDFGCSITSGALTKLLDFTEGHPYYSQLAIQQTVLGCSHKKTNETDVPEIIRQMMFAEAGYLEKCWDEMVSRRENIPVLLALAREEKYLYSAAAGKKVNVSRSIKYLVNTGLVGKDIRGYFITDPLLKMWINNNIINKT